MEALILIALPALLVWGLFALKTGVQSEIHFIPIAGLLVVLSGAVFGYDFFHLEGGPIPITIDRLLLAGLIAAFGVCWVRGSEELRFFNRSDTIIIGLVVVLTLSALTHDWTFADNRPVSRLLFFYYLPIALYFVVRWSRLGVRDLQAISILLGGFSLYLALTAIAETKEMTSLVFPRYIMDPSVIEFLGRGRGPFLNPVSDGIFMAVGAGAIWGWWPDHGRIVRGLVLGLTLLISVGIFCTLTRSVWLGFLLSLGLVVWFSVPRQTKGLLVIGATLAAIVAFPVVSEKIVSFKRDKAVSQADMERSASLRPLFAVVAWKMFQDRPVLGCGFGQYAQAKNPYLQDPYSGKPLEATRNYVQHNIFLAYLTETGIVGLAILLVMLLQMTRTSWLMWHHKGWNVWSRAYGMMMMVLLVNTFVNGMFHDVSIIPMLNVLLFFLFGIVNNLETAPVIELPKIPSGTTDHVNPQQQVGHGVGHHAIPEIASSVH